MHYATNEKENTTSRVVLSKPSARSTPEPEKKSTFPFAV
jgi:hypothetical protein